MNNNFCQLSLKLLVNSKKLQKKRGCKNIFITCFQSSMKDYRATCSFWKYHSLDSGEWSSEGIKTISYNQSGVHCECNHLTNFAVLISPYVAVCYFQFQNPLKSTFCYSHRFYLIRILFFIVLGGNTWRYTYIDNNHWMFVVNSWMHHYDLSLLFMLEVSELISHISLGRSLCNIFPILR